MCLDDLFLYLEKCLQILIEMSSSRLLEVNLHRVWFSSSSFSPESDLFLLVGVPAQKLLQFEKPIISSYQADKDLRSFSWEQFLTNHSAVTILRLLHQISTTSTHLNLFFSKILRNKESLMFGAASSDLGFHLLRTSWKHINKQDPPQWIFESQLL